MPTVSQLKQARFFVIGMSGEIKFPVLGGYWEFCSRLIPVCFALFCFFLFTISTVYNPVPYQFP